MEEIKEENTSVLAWGSEPPDGAPENVTPICVIRRAERGKATHERKVLRQWPGLPTRGIPPHWYGTKCALWWQASAVKGTGSPSAGELGANQERMTLGSVVARSLRGFCLSDSKLVGGGGL